MMYKAWIKCPQCGYFGIRTILRDARDDDRYWVCPQCGEKFKNKGIMDELK